MPRDLPQGISGELSSNHGILGLSWCLGLEIRVLRLKMTLELFVCSSTRECSRDEQLGMSLAFVERVNTLVVLDALVVLVLLLSSRLRT